jgi:non-specific serine/threonine protein kinase
VTAAGAYRPLVGRDRDIDGVLDLLVTERARLVSLVGPAGVGKTRLALAVADRLHDVFVDSVVFVDLAPTRDAELVLPTMARALAAEESTSLIEAVAERAMLFVLDNFEQVAAAAPSLGGLLGACPNLSLLVTSREPLAVGWEQLFDVGPLDCPPADETSEIIAQAPAVALFVQHARTVRPGFTLNASNARSIAEICRRLDGLPLAIELAAARMRVLSPEAILVQLRQRPLQLLSGGARDAPERHRTLREALAWSYGLLDPPQQMVFRRMSVFAGGFTEESAATVMDDLEVGLTLESLLDKHLLALAGEDLRFQPLETIREFGLELLQSAGEVEGTRGRHARCMVDLVEELAPGLYGARQSESSRRLLVEHNDVRTALDWCAASRDTSAVELGLRLAGALWLFWRLRGFVGEGRSRVSALLSRTVVGATVEPVAASSATESGLAPATTALARALHSAGYLAFAQAAAEDARRYLTASLEIGRLVGDAWSQSYALHGLGHAAMLDKDFSRARALYGERLSIAEAQHDQYALGQVLNALGEVARCLDEPGQALHFYAESLAVRRKLGDTRGVAMGVTNLGQVAIAEGDLATAREALAEGLELLTQLGHQYGQAVCIAGYAALAVAEGQPARAARLLGATTSALDDVSNTLEPADLLTFERTMAATRAALGAGFEADYARGRALSLEQARALLDTPCTVDSPTPERLVQARPSPPVPPRPLAERQPEAAAALSPREREVAALIARGLTSEAIADVLVISRRTADTHAAHIRDKLGLRSRAEIATWAIRHGLT